MPSVRPSVTSHRASLNGLLFDSLQQRHVDNRFVFEPGSCDAEFDVESDGERHEVAISLSEPRTTWGARRLTRLQCVVANRADLIWRTYFCTLSWSEAKPPCY
jgi:hypothetical protein